MDTRQAEDMMELAAREEVDAANKATMDYLRQRAIRLNAEVRIRDRRIAELEQDLAAHAADAQVPDEPAPDA